jgi:hypothetical protein
MGYFKAQGAELIAHAAAVPDMRSRRRPISSLHFAPYWDLLQKDGSKLPSRLLQGPEARLELGGTVFEFRHRGVATPWRLDGVAAPHPSGFSGDIVSGQIAVSSACGSTRAWVEALNALAQWNPKRIVPGHGASLTAKQPRHKATDIASHALTCHALWSKV